MAADGRLYFYQNHIGVTFWLNGELLTMDTVSEFREYGIPLQPSMCGCRWEYIFTPDITAADEVEIRLTNPHAHGNGSAYRDFLNTLYNSPDTSYTLESYLKSYSLPLQIAGIVLIIEALMLLGAATASGLLRVPMGVGLWRYSLLAFFAGGFVILDTVGISFISALVVFNTYARQLCLMLAVYCAGLCLCAALTGKREKAAKTALLLSALLNSVLIVLSFTGVMIIYDTGIYWAVSQAVLCPLLIVCTDMELRRRKKKDRLTLLSGICLLAAVALDLAGVGASIYSRGTCTKVVFTLVFVLHVAVAAKHIATDYQASIRARQLEKELADSRIATTLSQIQPHFIYNTLGTVEQLCKEQPEAASKLVRDFSLYLRGNFSELDSTTPILLSKEMEHVRHYVDIEHVRFPDMEVRFELRSGDFLLPALSVQPLVENAIKHGLMGLTAAVSASPDIASVTEFTACTAALEWAAEHPVDVAFLDISMRGMGGLALAEKLVALHPECSIIFCTGYTQYALDAIRLHVAGYLLKPITAEAVQKELDHIKGRKAKEKLLSVRCFGSFEVLARGEPLSFRRSRSKELLAVLVDRKGAGVTAKEICALMWPDSGADGKSVNYLYQLFSDLRYALEQAGAGEVLRQNGYLYALDTERVDCDYYSYLNTGRPEFRGEYMLQYSWAENTAGLLWNK